ncbi:37S ribosomal protein Rsm25 [Drepanopeziza brunnea f. sp. 'multigermtubi' MB_m1]|uniref:37S ribosomal protein S25, mitochondrial n=1 Tax=Marssonina brunnea f. sp. multigermtubi (strain MB_m1) TaxID=1072389 RepID=K1XMW9_MARBU|nr:37S ribosomal protein Rsm25 [Drepanopeziza brunnea f. sp. 'multigermtubi' MB_m1]EKD13819.1 37S ribosomal protein Rsm25 [Drepanopeziza brunnea f. sp. 'multigermtubi' MB_m1]
MRGLNLKPSRVYQAASALLETGSITQPPPWFKTIGSIPPAEILTRSQPTQHREVNHRSRVRKPSKLFKPQAIGYEEDKLRIQFYSDHPWELARPRIVLENDGKDGHRCDWSRIQQTGRQLSGESVVQRQLWLIKNTQYTPNQAYDIARKEFYELRHEEETERRVQREEATWTGAYFGKGVLEIGMELEDKAYESWKAWATKEVDSIHTQREAAYTGVGTEPEDTTEVSSFEEDENDVLATI